jgi:hypothetical protein
MSVDCFAKSMHSRARRALFAFDHRVAVLSVWSRKQLACTRLCIVWTSSRDQRNQRGITRVRKCVAVTSAPRFVTAASHPRSALRHGGSAGRLYRPLDPPRFCLRLVVFPRAAGGFLRGFTTAFLTVRFRRAFNCLVRRGRLRNSLRQ